MNGAGRSRAGHRLVHPAADGAQLAGPNVALQGNFDPAKLLSPIPVLRKEVTAMLDAFGGHPHIANLGHGILPNVPVDHAKAFVETVKNYQYEPAR